VEKIHIVLQHTGKVVHDGQRHLIGDGKRILEQLEGKGALPPS
jgi:hypothetical protein